ncbi:MAG: tetratricopeptide repeat protein [Aquimonas sp.]|jgi:predicted negative regulator of RcsB-dependent stress response|nr:tetratricopeptide repeat protein [Xanthomonadales bacterium]MCC6505494.1 tetratricopeptide repeat protein [Aquimonas sp.]
MSLEMMDEHERGERVRRWLHDNSGSLLGGIAAGLLCFFGWQWWQDSSLQAVQAAATDFRALSDAAERKDVELIDTLSKSLKDNHPETAFSAMAQMQLAATRLAANDIDGALQALETAENTAQNPNLKALARLRIARVQLAAGRADDALVSVGTLPAAFRGIADEVRGDALLASGQREEAIKAYEDALTHLDPGAPTRGMVQLKLDDVGAVTDVLAGKS